MKFYATPSPLAHLLVPLLGAVLSGAIIIPIAEAILELSNAYKLLILGVLFVLCLIWYMRAMRYKDYIEVTEHELNIVQDERRKDATPPLYVKPKDVKLVEIVTVYPTHQEPSNYLIYTHLLPEPLWIDTYQVPLNNFIVFPNSNNLPISYVTLQHADIDVEQLGKKYIVLKNHERNKKIRIAIPNIAEICHIHKHAYSIAQSYITLSTKDDELYMIYQYPRQIEELKEWCTKHGVSWRTEHTNRNNS